MNMNIRLGGILEEIMDSAVKNGLAKTKTDVISLGLLELEHKYHLLERLEDEEDLREAKRILEEVRAGKQKTYSLTEFEKRTGSKII